jgi:hypothetical protein
VKEPAPLRTPLSRPVEDRLVGDLNGGTVLASSGVGAVHRVVGTRPRAAPRGPWQITGSDQLCDVYQTVSETPDPGR